MARKKRRAYATDLTGNQWALIAPLIPEAEPGGRPRKASSRELVNAILYLSSVKNSQHAERTRVLDLGEYWYLPVRVRCGCVSWQFAWRSLA